MKINAKKFKELVDERGIPHVEVREMAGLSERTYNWILEHEFVEKRTLQRLAKIIGSSMEEIMQPDPGDEGENVLEFRRNEKTALLTLCQGRYITRVKELAKKHPEECKILVINKDNSILAEIPTEWIRINPGQELSEERKEALAEHARRNFSKSS